MEKYMRKHENRLGNTYSQNEYAAIRHSKHGANRYWLIFHTKKITEKELRNLSEKYMRNYMKKRLQKSILILMNFRV